MKPSADISTFTPAAHHDVLALILQIGILLLVARVLGELAQRLKQPSVVGEIFAGILLGPSILSGLFPGTIGIVVPANAVQGYLLEAVSLIGAIFLLLITGLETDLKLIKNHAKTALSISLCGIGVTFTSGFLLGQWLPDSLLADTDARLVFSLFIAISMSISAIPVIAKVLIDLKMTRRDVGQIMIAAGMSDDTIGWILLSIVAGLAASGTLTFGAVAGSVGKVALFLLLSFTFGQWLVKKIFNFVQNNFESKDALLTLVVVMTFLWGSITQLLHLEAVLGAFVMGVLFGQLPRVPEKVIGKLETVALSIFAPIFFSVAGLKVDINKLLTPQLITITVVVIAIASIGKVIGTYCGARFIGKKDHWTALSFGAALNARGAMEIIVATIGLSLGILTQEMFSIIVVMAMTTSLMSPFALRWILKRVKPDRQERSRLKKEETEEDSDVLNLYRVLMPVRYRKKDDHFKTMQLLKAQVIEKIGHDRSLSITLLCVERHTKGPEYERFLDNLSANLKQHEVQKKVVTGKDTVGEILKECEKDYEMLILGAAHHPHSQEYIFSPVVDELIKSAPCQTMVVHAQTVSPAWQPGKILVPTNGTAAASTAVEFALMFGELGHETVHVLNVVEWDDEYYYGDVETPEFRKRIKMADSILKPLKEHGELKSVDVKVDVRVGANPGEEIIKYAAQIRSDLIILGTHSRSTSSHLFLGTHIEQMLQLAPCPVVILNS